MIFRIKDINSKLLTNILTCILLVLFLLPTTSSMAQFRLTGTVLNQYNKPITGAHLYLQDNKTLVLSDENGSFKFENLARGNYRLHVSYVGYKCIHPYRFTIDKEDVDLAVIMEPENQLLNEVVVNGILSISTALRKPDAFAIAGQEAMESSRDHSLVRTLEMLPGLQAMDIGQGSSKPVIRGLGFNRVVVVENNTRVEGQQWGFDHGLEVDQFAAEIVEVVKGPSSLRYGPEAIGGALVIRPHAIAPPNTIESTINLLGRSVNDMVAASAMIRMRTNNYYSYLRYTQTDFGLYKVPADRFDYNTYIFPLKDGLVLNSGGHERNFYFSNGLIKQWGKVSLSMSNVNSSSGFFPGAHGMPNLGAITAFPAQRKPQLPYQQVNHFKTAVNGQFNLRDFLLNIDLAYQHNLRQEWSRFHTHYPGQTAPRTNPDLELEWSLHTYSADFRLIRHQNPGSTIETGLSFQHQDNRIGGYMFLLPKYLRNTAGVFGLYSISLSDKTKLSTGLRYDLGILQIEKYVSPYTQLLKSPDYQRSFNDLSWAIGIVHRANEHLSLKSNLAKSFRIPTASEIGSNGIHHGSFRYELGDQELDSEKSFQFDAGIIMERPGLILELSGFAGYFPNFIYLNPSGSFLLPDGNPVPEAGAGQVYQFVQSEAYRIGGEFVFQYQLYKKMDLKMVGEYVFASDGKYPIPLTPPFTLLTRIQYKFPDYWKHMHQSAFVMEQKLASAQNRHARNEDPTEAWHIYSVGFETKIITRALPIGVRLSVQNLFNTTYWNHLSYYRQIGLPEAGRNLRLGIRIPLESKLK